MRRDHARRRAAFTLIELLVALTVGGVALLSARALVEAVGDASAVGAREAAASDSVANRHRLLVALVARAEVSERAGELMGDERAARFGSWCDVPGGWQERCTVTIGLDAVGETRVLAVATSPGGVVVLASGFESASLRYLASPAAGGTWLRRWGAGLSSPVALGIVIDQDTMLVRFGSRP